ncbi:hypothetical protein SAMN05444161_1656 [Rhizobiales bacterium GAS191]|nr:hypothetical protein SAMN05444161_1656 [Rhizobiales bacterium GAS191]
MASNRVAYPVTQIVPYHGWNRTPKIVGGPVGITATDLGTINNTVQLFTVPKGFTIIGIVIDNPQLDSSTGLTVSIGDSATASRLLASSTSFRAAAFSTALPQGVAGFRYSADTDIQLTIVAAATTAVAGNLTVYLIGYIDN